MIETWTHIGPLNGFKWKETTKKLYIKHTEYFWICSQRNTWMRFRRRLTQKLQSELHKQQCIAAYVITTKIIQHHNGIMTRIHSFVLNSQQQLTPHGFVTCLDKLLWWCGNKRPNTVRHSVDVPHDSAAMNLHKLCCFFYHLFWPKNSFLSETL